ncbi:MAG TPA: glycosyltransferase family 2 protein [Longimicrobiales bacterium]|nr:glycosyltransferase family 2 protein [Longimicrobiales bacterium]
MSSISVVIPTYNRAELLVRTVRSVLAQSTPATEILVVDDGSTDHTPDVCREFPEPVRCIRQDNRGLPGARNRGITEARGEWIALCDSDDLWHPHKLERQLAALDATAGAVCCLTGCERIDGDDRPISGDTSGWQAVFGVFNDMGTTPDEWFARWLDARNLEIDGRTIRVYSGDAFAMLFAGNIALPSSALIARRAFDEAGLFDETFRVAEETEFFHRLTARFPIAVLMDDLVGYRVGHSSIVSTATIRLIENALESNRRAGLLRPRMNDIEAAAQADGRRRLQRRLARARLTFLDRAGARAAALDAFRDHRSPYLATLVAATWLPESALRGMHGAKRLVRALTRRSA